MATESLVTDNQNPSKMCFHCGLPNKGLKLSENIQGETQYFCCHGCKAVAQLIREFGNEDYYQFRKNYQTNAFPISEKQDQQKLSVFDKREIQKKFIRPCHDNPNYIQVFLLLENLRCAACVWLNEQHLRKLKGIIDVHVDYTSQQARVVWNPEIIKLSGILKAIEAIGYRALPFNPVKREILNKEQKRKNFTRLIFTGILGMEVMMHAVATYWMGGYDVAGNLQLWEKIGRYTDLIVVSVMLFYSGADFYISAWRDLKNKHLGMDVPIVLGLTVAYFGSVVATVTQKGEVYFDSIAMFLFLMLAAKIYELKGRLLAGKSLDKLLKIIPKTAKVLTDKLNNKYKEVLLADLKPGDELIINPGEIIPVDGTLTQGKSSFDESLLTGEMMPVLHKQGDVLINGSCNIDQRIRMKVETNQQNSTLFSIFSLLEKGQEKKTQQALLSTKVAKWFVLSILIIALLTAIFWYFYDSQHLLAVIIAVFIISCPCALALATPVALSISSGHFAHHGIVPLNMPAFENITQADTVVFDKTGTLTQGKTQLKKTQLVSQDNPITVEKALNIASSLEWQLLHPIAQAFYHVHKSQPYQVKELKNFPGKGVRGEISNETWKIGKLSFCTELSAIPTELLKEINAIRIQQATVIGLAKNNQLMAYFVLIDCLKSSAKTSIKQLKKQGIKNFIILSGDNIKSIIPIAQTLSISKYYGSMTPIDKLNWIKKYKSEGHKVIMVGDGINDAPTLSAADASVSFAHASDIAQINSDFVLLNSNLDLLPTIHTISSHTHHIILQNFSWAIVYNIVAIPFAALGFLPPWIAALGMSLSSFVVIGNSLRLNKKKNGQQT